MDSAALARLNTLRVFFVDLDYMVNPDVIKTVDELRWKIENLETVGTKNHEKVLELNKKFFTSPTRKYR